MGDHDCRSIRAPVAHGLAGDLVSRLAGRRYERLRDLAPEHHEALWGWQSFYRAFSTVNGGRGRETDLFEGIRAMSERAGSTARDGPGDVPCAGASTGGSGRGAPRIACRDGPSTSRRVAIGGARARSVSDGPLPEDGRCDPAALLERTADLLFEHSLFNGHPRFFGYITASPAPIGMLGDLLAAAVNPNVGAWTLAPAATEIESRRCAGSPS